MPVHSNTCYRWKFDCCRKISQDSPRISSMNLMWEELSTGPTHDTWCMHMHMHHYIQLCTCRSPSPPYIIGYGSTLVIEGLPWYLYSPHTFEIQFNLLYSTTHIKSKLYAIKVAPLAKIFPVCPCCSASPWTHVTRIASRHETLRLNRISSKLGSQSLLLECRYWLAPPTHCQEVQMKTTAERTCIHKCPFLY